MKHFSSIGKPLAIFSVLWFQFAVESSQLYAQDSDLGVESVTVVKNYAPVVLVGPKPILAPLLSDYVLPKNGAAVPNYKFSSGLYLFACLGRP